MSEKAKTVTDADLLAKVEKSPYVFPANEYKSVEGKSKLKGSWRPQAGKAAN